MSLIQHQFTAMGSTCDIAIAGGAADLATRAQARVEELEQCWSRFRADSELSQLNARAGEPVALSFDAYLLVDRAITAWKLTRGRFDPTVLTAIEAAGYDRSFERIGTAGATTSAVGPNPPVCPAPGCASIVLDEPRMTVTLPVGAGIDPGGIGKGLAADLVAEMLMQSGASGACVSMGGDVRVIGDPPSGDVWRVGIANPYMEGDLITVLGLRNHGVATSTRLIRRWEHGGSEHHHLFDPATGASVARGLDSVSLVAGEAWWAEVVAKATLIAGPRMAENFVKLLGGAALLIEDRDTVRSANGFERFVVPDLVPA